MEYSDLFGEGDVNGAGDIPTREESLEWIRRVNAVLERPPSEAPCDHGKEYSAWLIDQQEAWLEQQRVKASTRASLATNSGAGR